MSTTVKTQTREQKENANLTTKEGLSLQSFMVIKWKHNQSQ